MPSFISSHHSLLYTPEPIHTHAFHSPFLSLQSPHQHAPSSPPTHLSIDKRFFPLFPSSTFPSPLSSSLLHISLSSTSLLPPQHIPRHDNNPTCPQARTTHKSATSLTSSYFFTVSRFYAFTFLQNKAQ